MALTSALTSNEVFGRAGTEKEHVLLKRGESETIWLASGSAVNLPETLRLAHAETGSGLDLVQRSVLQVVLNHNVEAGDGTDTDKTVATLTLQFPRGKMTTYDMANEALARLGSVAFTASNASSLFKYDGTGNGVAGILARLIV